MCVELMDYLYPYVQQLVVELNLYALMEAMEIIKGSRSVMITDIKLEIVS